MKRLVPVAVLLLALAGIGAAPAQPASGRCVVPVAGSHIRDYVVTSTLSAELPDGSLVVGSSRQSHGRLVVKLRRVTSGCSVENLAPVSFRSSEFGAIDAMTATSDGQLLIAGGDGKRALVGRLLASGQLDRSFGNDGWESLKPHEPPEHGFQPVFTATSIAVAPSGAIVVGENDGGAHCCVRDYVSKLTANGVPVWTRYVQDFGGSYTTDVSVIADGSVYAQGEYEESGCGGPAIVLIRPDGSFDARFDRVIERTIRRIQRPRSLRFTPTLVANPAGGFLLVGGLDRTCIGPRRWTSDGVAVSVEPSGAIGRRTRFHSPNYTFDSPAAIQLASGRIVTAAFAYPAKGGRPKSLLVQWLAAGGSRAGRQDLRPTGRGSYRLVSLLPRGANGAWLVAGLPREIDITPLPTGS